MLLTKGRIGVLMGGQSAEREVSLKTGKAISEALSRRGYRVVPIDVDASLPSRLRTKKIEVAFVALHGPVGEDGTIQGLLEISQIPYTGSGVRASAVAMDKVLTRALFQAHGIPVPPGMVLYGDRPKRVPHASLRFPLVVKPASQGSTIGVSLVQRQSTWLMALRKAYHYGSTAIVESYIEGREVAISVMDGTTFPPVEIVAPGGFYDFAAKYKKAQTRYLCPAPLSPKVVKQLEDLAVRAYTIMECTGVARVDFRLNRMSRPFVLEVNTIPGMTERSLLPMAAAEMGLPYDTLVEKILESAVRKHKALGVKRNPKARGKFQIEKGAG